MADDPPRTRAARATGERAPIRIVHHYGARPEFVVLGGLAPELSTEVFEAMPEGEVRFIVTFTAVDGRTILTLLVQCASNEDRDTIINSGMEGGMQEQMDSLGTRLIGRWTTSIDGEPWLVGTDGQVTRLGVISTDPHAVPRIWSRAKDHRPVRPDQHRHGDRWELLRPGAISGDHWRFRFSVLAATRRPSSTTVPRP